MVCQSAKVDQIFKSIWKLDWKCLLSVLKVKVCESESESAEMKVKAFVILLMFQIFFLIKHGRKNTILIKSSTAHAFLCYAWTENLNSIPILVCGQPIKIIPNINCIHGRYFSLVRALPFFSTPCRIKSGVTRAATCNQHCRSICPDTISLPNHVTSG